MNALIILLWVGVFAQPKEAVEYAIGYDCRNDGQNQTPIKAISLREVDECELTTTNIKSTNVTVKIIEKNKQRDISVFQCKIKLRRDVKRCSIFGYLEPIDNGVQESILETSYENCRNIIITRTYLYDSSHIIRDLVINETNYRGIYLAGDAIDNSCHSGTFSDKFGTWSKVIVQGVFSITLNEYTARLDTIKNTVVLRSGTVCDYAKKSCIDAEGGYTFWDNLVPQGCLEDNYNSLYEGLATETLDSYDKDSKEIIYTVRTEDFLFSLLKTGEKTICDKNYFTTEHPSLFLTILDDKYISNDHNGKSFYINDISLPTYFNSKLVYTERHIKTQMEILYTDILRQKCETERDFLKQSISLASLSPDIFAYMTIGPGHITKISGEIGYIIKCKEERFEVVTNTTACYEQLPVWNNHTMWFLTPITRILTSHGVETDCVKSLPLAFELVSGWSSSSHELRYMKAPEKLHPNYKKTWKFENPGPLMTGGTYKWDVLQQFYYQLTLPAIRTPILNNMLKPMMNNKIIHQDSYRDYMEENFVTKFRRETLSWIWEDLKDCGDVTSVFITIFFIFHVVKIMVDTIINGFSLAKLYGFSFALLGALFSSITHFLHKLAEQRRNERVMESEVEETENIPNPPEVPPKPSKPSKLLVKRGSIKLKVHKVRNNIYRMSQRKKKEDIELKEIKKDNNVTENQYVNSKSFKSSFDFD